MAHTVDAVVYDPLTGFLQMLVIPDDDKQLDDPAYNPPGMVHLRVPRTISAALAAQHPGTATTVMLAAARLVSPLAVNIGLTPPPPPTALPGLGL